MNHTHTKHASQQGVNCHFLSSFLSRDKTSQSYILWWICDQLHEENIIEIFDWMTVLLCRWLSKTPFDPHRIGSALDPEIPKGRVDPYYSGWGGAVFQVRPTRCSRTLARPIYKPSWERAALLNHPPLGQGLKSPTATSPATALQKLPSRASFRSASLQFIKISCMKLFVTFLWTILDWD